MNFSFLEQTPGQSRAAGYIDRVAGVLHGELTVGGHSKGGNFAVYGAAFCDKAARGRIVRVYSNDGPGFRSDIVDTPNYRSVVDRTVKIIPESSLVGILLSDRENRRVVSSSAKGVMQHDPYSWTVLGDSFVEADDRSLASIFMDDTLHRWVASLSDEDLRVMVDTVFDTLQASGVSTLAEINADKRVTYSAILKAAAKVDPSARAELGEIFKKLLTSGRDAMYAETRKSISKALRPGLDKA